MYQVSSLFIKHVFCRDAVCITLFAWQKNSTWILAVFVASPEFHCFHLGKQHAVLYAEDKYEHFCNHISKIQFYDSLKKKKVKQNWSVKRLPSNSYVCETVVFSCLIIPFSVRISEYLHNKTITVFQIYCKLW